MEKIANIAVPLGALLAAAAVGLGAYGAHGLDKLIVSRGYEADLQQRLAWFETGVRYHMYHALGLVLIGILARSAGQSTMLGISCITFLAGILLFSGSLYAMAIVSENFRWLGAIVPLGGLSYIVGWVVLAVAAWRN